MSSSAIVVLNWNGIDFLKRYLPTLVRECSSPDYKVYLADNGSTDNSVEWVRQELAMVEVIELDMNYGFAGGYNQALALIEADYFVIINSDIEVTPDWLRPITDHLDHNPGTAICQPKIMSTINRDYFEYAGAAGGYIDRFGYPFCRGRIQDHLEIDSGQYNDQRNIFWASGACMVIRSSVWKEMNGLDSDFFAHMEEIDLCWRVLKAGYDIVYIPGSVVYHVGGGTLSYDSPKKIYLNFRNNLYLLHKNLPGANYRLVIFTRMLLDGIAGIRFLLMLRFNSCWQIFIAHLSYYRSIRALTSKRREIAGYARPIKKGLILNKSVIAGFYLKGKKVFTDYNFEN